VSELRKENLRNCTVAILGMAFKAESDDRRDSLSYKLKKLLEVEAAQVLCADPYVADPSLVSAEEAIERADIVILGAPHAVYRNLEIPPQKLAIDVWGVWPAENSSRKEVRANASVGRS
jgi:UDP-N-acetyl-D-mannosaminuronic acid dehydrogenase